MTVIIGVKGDKNVYIGVDSRICINDSHIISKHSEEKIFYKDDFAFAFAGDVRAHNVFKHHLEMTGCSTGRNAAAYRDAYDWIYRMLPIQILRAFGAMNIKSIDDIVFDVIFVHQPTKKLFSIDNTLTIIQHEDVVAGGSGAEYVLGAYTALKALSEKLNKTRNIGDNISMALEITGKFCSDVGAPYVVAKF